MSERTYAFLTPLIGLICGYVIIRHLFFFGNSMILRNDLVQGFFVGFGLAIVTIEIYARVRATRINGWITMFGCGLPGDGLLMRAASARIFPGPVNVPQEAMYWRTNVDGAGHTLSGEHNYLMHFPPGGLPPNEAFWSLTMADEKEHFVANPINRYLVGNRSGLVPDMAGRYYSVQFTDPSKNTNFAYVGTRTTGTQAGDYLISWPGWNGTGPQGVKQISSPNNAVLAIGRVLVESDGDLAIPYGLTKQIQLTPLSHWQPGQ
jgi:hypothetical protein